MPEGTPEFADLLAWDADLPRPQWQLVHDRVASIAEDERRREVWSAAAGAWLRGLAYTLGAPYVVHESTNFLMMSAYATTDAASVLRHCEACRQALDRLLPDIAAFQSPGKLAVVHLAHSETYYTYISCFYGEGEFGSSSGMHIRDGYPHVVLHGSRDLLLTLAHELMHAAIAHRNLPLWIEEGLTQLFECDAGGREAILVTPEIANKQKTFWRRESLAGFWRGESFTRADEGQELSYQLAEILLRLLVGEHRPRWLGWDQRPVQKLYGFLSHAQQADFGQAAAQQHLGFGIQQLAAKFLGAGDWSPPDAAELSSPDT